MDAHGNDGAIIALLQSVGLSISKREVERLLTEKHDAFIAEGRPTIARRM